MKRLALLLALVTQVASAQIWDSVRVTDTPNGGRVRINWSFQHVADSVAGLASGQTPTAIFTKYTSVPRHIPYTSAQWMDSLKTYTGSVSSYYGNLLRITQGQGTSASSYYVRSWYPTTTGHSSTGGDAYTTGQLLESIDPSPSRWGFQTYRDSSSNMIIGRQYAAAASNTAILGGLGLDIRLIPDRVYGSVLIGNKLDANGNLTFDGGTSGSSYTSPHGLLNVYRRGIKYIDGSLNYANGDDVYAIKAEHHFENLTNTVYGGAVQGWTYFSGASKANGASGFGGGIWSTSSAQLNRMMAGDFNVYLNNASGIIDTAYGLRVYTSIGPLGGTISNSYGIYVSPLAGTKRYAGYFAGTTDSVVVEGPMRVQKIRFNDGTTMTTATVDTSGGGTWGTITGALPSQGDLTDTLNNRKAFTQAVKDTVEAVKARAYLSTLTTGHMAWLDVTTLKNVTVTGAGGSFSAGTLTLSGGGGAGTWGSITGTLNSQTDLKDTLVNRKTFTQVVKDTGDARYARTARFDTSGHYLKTSTTEKLYLDIVGGNLTVKIGTDGGGGGGSGGGSLDSIYSGGTMMIIERLTDSTYRIRVDSTKWRTQDTTLFPYTGNGTLWKVSWDHNQGKYVILHDSLGGGSSSSDTLGWWNAKRWGVTGDGSTDDATALDNLLGRIKPTGGTLFLPRGTYKVSSSINYNSDKPLRILADGATINGSTSTAEVLVNLGGARVSSGNLTSSPLKGANSFTVGSGLASQLSAGSVVMLTSAVSWDAGSAYFTKGEMAIVQGVASTTVTLRSPLYDGYSTVDTLVLINAPQIQVDGLSIVRNGDYIGLQVKYAKDIALTNMRMEGARKGCLYLYNVLGGTVNNLYATDCYMSGYGYGVAILSSQGMTISNNHLFGGRHAITNGGDFPVRDMLFTGNVVDNLHGQSPQLSSFDLHPNSEYIKIVGNTILNGLVLSGINYVVSNNTIIGMDAVPLNITVEHSQPRSYRKFTDNFFQSFNTASSYPAVMIQALTRAGRAEEISFTGDRIRSAYYGFRFIGNAYTTQVSRLILNNVTVEDSLGGFMDINTPAAQIDTVVMRDCAWNSHKIIMDCQTASGKEFVADNTTFTLRLNGEYGIKLGAWVNAKITDSYFRATHASGGWMNTFTNTGTLDIYRTVFDNWESKNGLSISGPSATKVYDCRFINGSGTPDGNDTLATRSYARSVGGGTGGASSSGTLDSIYTGSGFITATRMTDSTYRIGFDSTKFRLFDTTNVQIARGNPGYVVTMGNTNPGSLELTEIKSPYKRGMTGASNNNSLYRYYPLGMVTNLTPSTMTATSGNFTAYPFEMPYTVTTDTLRWEVSTASASAGFVFGIYANESDSTLYPTTRLTQQVIYDTASVGVKAKATGSDIILLAGQTYWLCYSANSATPVVRGIPLADMKNFLGVQATMGVNNMFSCLRVARSYDWTMPATAPASLIPIANIIMPQVLVRIK